MIKRFLKSKTILVALAIEILGVIQLNADFLSTVMSPAQFGWMLLGIGIVMKVLRAMTTGSLGEK
jgi:hypothetical protein